MSLISDTTKRIRKNYTEYQKDEAYLTHPTAAVENILINFTNKIKCKVLDTIVSHEKGDAGDEMKTDIKMLFEEIQEEK